MPSEEPGSAGRPIEPSAGRTPYGIFAVLIVAAVAAVSYPNLNGFWGRDDFACIALARMIGPPWHLFATDHFFVPGSVFRPLGFFSEWLCIKLFGTDYAPNAAFDVALHAAVALSLFRLMLRPSIPPIVAALCALLFGLHPATVGPSLWWSGRFDLQSTLFILLAILAGLRYRERMTKLALMAALAAALAAMLSKENGLVAVAALTVLWGRWMFVASAQRTRALIAIALAWTVGIGFFLWRWIVLGTFSSGFTEPLSVGEAIRRGLLNWMRDAPGYLSFFPHLADFSIGLIVTGTVVAVAALAVVWVSWKRRESRNADILLIGLLLFVAPIVTQAPIAAFGSPLLGGMSAIEAGMQSRLYYLQTAGLMMMIAAAIGPLYRAASALPRYAVATSMALVVATFAWTSHVNARAFAQRSFDIAEPARAAVAAVDQLALPENHCHLVFLGYAPPPEWDIFVSMDSIVKGLSANKQIRNCWIHSNSPTHFHMQSRTVTQADALPFRPEQRDDEDMPWRRVGKLVFAYLRLADPVTFHDPGMRFFAMKDGRFVDVSDDVLAGRFPAPAK